MAKPGTAQAEFEGLYIELQAALLRQLPRPAAFTRETLEKLLQQQAALKRGLAPLTEGRFGGFTAPAEPNLRYDKRRDGWTLLEHAPRRIVSVTGLELVPFLRLGESTIRGYDLIGRARYEFDADLGQEDAEFILEHQEEIPEEFRQFYLPFTATVWRYPDGALYVPCLFWGGGRWCLDFFLWLEYEYDSHVRLLRLGK